ncbi:transglutaminase-like domain-containing protein [Derxia gummosa]|uniref:Transglutaminase-like domain-containing protein n=1 Tax=Derxia gummosa DSM 723 TaxID=1121388 RepID=A0AC36KLK1_9BURK
MFAPGADLVLGIHAAQTARQRLCAESLDITPALHWRVTPGPDHNRRLRLSAPPGRLRVRYAATVAIEHHVAAPASLAEVPVHGLPDSVLPWLLPSRYCESDVLHGLALEQFGRLPRGHARVTAIRDWVNRRVRFRSGSSNASTTACDTARSGEGVCRDFAHLMIALCRAVGIPARFTTGLDYGADPALGPSDFHAYVEAYLGHRWYLFDPSGTALPMGFVRIATGRDAADVAFATIYGPVDPAPPVVGICAVAGEDGELRVPLATAMALSTDGG